MASVSSFILLLIHILLFEFCRALPSFPISDERNDAPAGPAVIQPVYYSDIAKFRRDYRREPRFEGRSNATGASWTPILPTTLRDDATPPPPSPVDQVIRTVKPLAYDLNVKVPLQDSFLGSLVFHFELMEESREIPLHASQLRDYKNITLLSQNGTEVPLLGTKIESTMVRFLFGERMGPGEYLLTIGEFRGQVHNNQSTGIFSRLDGQLIATHFQPEFARQLLPCVDDPVAKASFRLTVVHPTSTVCQSNTIVNDVQVSDGQWQSTIFSATPKLPTYLLAFSVMPDKAYLQLSRQTTFGVTLRVHARERGPALRVLDIALASMELLDSMMQIPLLLNKIDLILVPSYDGGMENWGHVLVSETLASKGDDSRLMYVVAHELAHHWIGDKVTVNSWQYVCLQEDLTDYVTFKLVGVLLGHDSRFERFKLAKYVEIQLAEDFLSPEHSLLLPQKIDNNMISSHCYLKGAVHLHTLESIVGEEYMLHTIRNLVQNYQHFDLQTFMSFFEGVGLGDNIALSQVYHYWFLTGGFPSVRVENTGDKVVLKQTADRLWPLRLSSSVVLPQFFFSQRLTISPQPTPLLLNLNFTSFYRVDYDEPTWEAIFAYMAEDPTVFSAVGRAQLVSDFCFFHAQNPNNSTLKQQVFDIVYSNPKHFDLCDWNLYWCYAVSGEVSVFTSLLRRITDRLSTLFDQETSYGCRHGQAVHTINSLCQGILGRKCIRKTNAGDRTQD